MNLMKRFTGHLGTVVKHKNLVFKHCVKAGIGWQGFKHDISKFSPAEFIPGVRFYQGFRSPNEAERESFGYSAAWLHHKGRNRHHYEYWNDYDPKVKKVVPVKMPVKYVVEMMCDRMAASKTYMKDKYTDASPLEYYNRRSDHDELHPETAKLLENLLNMLADDGEEKTFEYLRKFRKQKDY